MLPLGSAVENLKRGKLGAILPLAVNAAAFGFWCAGTAVSNFFSSPKLPKGMDRRLADHVRFAHKQARRLALTGTYYMVKHQAGLQKRQSRLVELSKLSLWSTVMLVTAMHAHASGDEATIAAADIMCQVLRHKIEPQHPSDKFYRDCSKLSRQVIDGSFKQLDGTVESAIVHPYAQ